MLMILCIHFSSRLIGDLMALRLDIDFRNMLLEIIIMGNPGNFRRLTLVLSFFLVFACRTLGCCAFYGGIAAILLIVALLIAFIK